MAMMMSCGKDCDQALGQTFVEQAGWIERTVTLMRKTLVECNARGDRMKLRGHRITNAKRLNGGW